MSSHGGRDVVAGVWHDGQGRRKRKSLILNSDVCIDGRKCGGAVAVSGGVRVTLHVFRQVVRPGKGMLAKLALKLLFALKRKEKGVKFLNCNKTTY